MKNTLGGVCVGGQSVQNKTGDWRYYRPVLIDGVCNGCGMCELYCPDSCINLNEGTHLITIDYAYCKGCGICAKECARGALRIVEEEK